MGSWNYNKDREGGKLSFVVGLLVSNKVRGGKGRWETVGKGKTPWILEVTGPGTETILDKSPGGKMSKT